MTTPTRWDPFKELEELHHRLSTLVGRAPLSREGEKREALTMVEWTPLVDIIEEEKGYLLLVEIPEVKRDDIKLSVDNDVLTISGDRKLEKADKGRKYHRVERAYGTYARSFTVPEDTDPSKIQAEYKDGVLRVYLAKTERARPKTIEVKVN